MTNINTTNNNFDSVVSLSEYPVLEPGKYLASLIKYTYENSKNEQLMFVLEIKILHEDIVLRDYFLVEGTYDRKDKKTNEILERGIKMFDTMTLSKIKSFLDAFDLTKHFGKTGFTLAKFKEVNGFGAVINAYRKNLNEDEKFLLNQNKFMVNIVKKPYKDGFSNNITNYFQVEAKDLVKKAVKEQPASFNKIEDELDDEIPF